MSFRLSFEITALPRMTNPSGRPQHWAIKKKEADKWKGLVAQAIHAAGPSPIRLPVQTAKLKLTRFSSVQPDSDGLVSGFKHVVDGLVRAGVLTNDKYKNVGMPQYLWEYAKPKAGRIRVEVFVENPAQEEFKNV